MFVIVTLSSTKKEFICNAFKNFKNITNIKNMKLFVRNAFKYQVGRNINMGKITPSEIRTKLLSISFRLIFGLVRNYYRREGFRYALGNNIVKKRS